MRLTANRQAEQSMRAPLAYLFFSKRKLKLRLRGAAIESFFDKLLESARVRVDPFFEMEYLPRHVNGRHQTFAKINDESHH